jgi:hypothetical protein
LSERSALPRAQKADGAKKSKSEQEEFMLELLDQQKSLTINQWKIFTACLFSIVIDFFDFGI